MNPNGITISRWGTQLSGEIERVAPHSCACVHLCSVQAAGLARPGPAHRGYNRNVKRTLIACAILALLGLAGCQKNIQNNDAVRQGIINYLSQHKGLDVNSMVIEVTEVTFRDKEADAVVMFKPKGGDAANGMSMKYTLERQGNAWVVKKKADSGGHAATAPGASSMPMPSGAMPMPSTGALPPGHPPAPKTGAGGK